MTSGTTPGRDRTRDACFVCGGDSFDWGDVQHPVNNTVVFVPDSGKPKTFWTLEETTREPLRGRRCNGCGNVQMFVRSYLDSDERRR